MALVWSPRIGYHARVWSSETLSGRVTGMPKVRTPGNAGGIVCAVEYRPDPGAPDDPRRELVGGAWTWRQSHAGLLRDALQTWQGNPSRIRLHLTDAMMGEPRPESIVPLRYRLMAEALFYEVATNSRRAPKLYRGAASKPHGLTSWTTSERVARGFLEHKDGEVFALEAGELGIRVSDYLRGTGFDREREWILWRGPCSSGRPMATRQNPIPGSGGFWGSAGAGVLPLALSTGRVLLGLRSEDVNEGGTWGVWGGAFQGAHGEDDEPVAAFAALREFREETRWDGEDGGLVPLLVFERPGFRYFNFLLPLPKQFTPLLNWEHDEAGWFDLDRLPEELHFGLQELLEDPASVATIRSYIARRKPKARR